MIGCMSLASVSCSDDSLDNRSIFDTARTEQNDFDKWIQKNFTDPYNVELVYKLNDNISDYDYDLAPAEYSQSVKLAKIIKHVWFGAYDEVAGVDFTRQLVPRTIHFVGSPAYNSDGTMVLGTAEGGLVITLYMVNNMNKYLSQDNYMELLNHYYFKTMHHEFGHILHQKKPYDTNFPKICEGLYIGGDWYLHTETEAHQLGFISQYSRNMEYDDFVELIANYVTHDQEWWDAAVADGNSTDKDGTTHNGGDILEEKLAIVKAYCRNSWGFDLDKLRDAVQRRSKELSTMDLTTLN